MHYGNLFPRIESILRRNEDSPSRKVKKIMKSYVMERGIGMVITKDSKIQKRGEFYYVISKETFACPVCQGRLFLLSNEKKKWREK